MAFHSIHDMNPRRSAAIVSSFKIWLNDTTRVVLTAFADCLWRVLSRNSLLIRLIMSLSVFFSSRMYSNMVVPLFVLIYATTCAIANSRSSNSVRCFVIALSWAKSFRTNDLFRKATASSSLLAAASEHCQAILAFGNSHYSF